MSTITDIKSVLTQKNFDVLCRKFHIPEEVHPQLPTPDQTIHDKPEGKIGIYTRYFRINFSQLSVIGAAKVSHFEILCCNGFYCVLKTTNDSLKIEQTLLLGLTHLLGQALFPWNTYKSVPILSFSEKTTPPSQPTLILMRSIIAMLVGSFRLVSEVSGVVERERVEGEAEVLETTVGRTVPLLPVALVSTQHTEAEVESIPKSADPPIMTEAVVTTEAAGVSSHLFPKTVVDTSSRFGPDLFLDSDSADTERPVTASTTQRPEVECGRQASLLKSKDEEIEVLKAQLTVKEAEAAEAIRLHAQIVAMERAYTDEVNVLQHNNAILESEKNTFNDKVMELQSSLSAKDLEAKELAATAAIAKSQNDSLVDQVNVLEGACSELREQVSAYESLKEQIEEFQDEQMRVMFDKLAKLEEQLSAVLLKMECKLDLRLGLSMGNRVGDWRSLWPIILLRKRTTNYDLKKSSARWEFSLLADLKSNKDASTEAVMNLLRLSDPLANLPGMSDLQPDVEQLMVPIHRPEDQVVLGASSLTFSLSVSRDRVERIRRNIAEHRSALAGVFAPLAEPFSVQSLTSAANTFDAAPSAAATTTALSTTFASASTIPPVSVDDYVVADVVNEENVQPNVEYKGEGSAAADINFEKEELDTTP
ncbi:hypothetical protein Tco_0807811 [Tanacetum coccineum]